MNTTMRLLRIVAAGMLLCLASHAQAQFREPEVLPNLVWRGQNTPPEAEMMWQVQQDRDLVRDFEFGWNWSGIFRSIGNELGMRRIHVGDARLNTNNNNMNAAILDHFRHMLTRDRVDNMQLIPSVRGIGQGEGAWLPDQNGDPPDQDVGRLGEERTATNPSETVAMEFAPWLEPIGRTGHFVLLQDDVSGSVFGWMTRRRGAVTNTNGTYRMRYDRRAAGQVAGDNPVLDEAAPDGELRRWEPANSPYHNVYFNNQNTRIMEVAVTLRRTEDDPATGTPDDPVLTIELPYAMRTDQLGQLRIVFSEVPRVPVAWNRFDDLSAVRIAIVNQFFVAPPPNTTQFVITRRMLPAMADPEREVTLIARFLCDARVDRNPLIRDEMGRHADENEIGRIGIRVTHNDDPVNGLGVELRNIRLQTPEAGRLFTGQHDERVQRNANTFLADLRDLDMAITGRTAQDAPTMHVWMFYGRDEGPKCYWKSYRYLNTLLDGRLMTEAGVEDPDEFRHCVGSRVVWQGAAVTASPQNASYAHGRGYNRDVQAAPGATDDQKDEIKRTYANVRYGMADMVPDDNATTITYRDDPDTYLEWDLRTMESFQKRPSPLPLPEQGQFSAANVLRLAQRDQTRGVLADLEQRLILDYAQMPGLLFGPEPWLGQVWLNYHMQVRGGPQPPFAAFDNNRPRTVGEARTAMWLPIILGAKGLMLYRGFTSREGTGEPFTPNPANLVTPDGTSADNLEGGILGNFPIGPGSPDPGAQQANLRQWLGEDGAGADWMTVPDPSNVTGYFAPNFATVCRNLALDPAATGPDRLYVGTRTVRGVAIEVMDRVRAMNTLLGKGPSGTAPTDPNILMSLQLEGWYGHGFSTIDVRRNATATSNPLSRLVDIPNIAARFRTRHPYRNRDVVAAVGNPGHFNSEPYDSSFYDLTLHSLETDRAMNQACILGVLNRRTDPRMLPVPTPPATRASSFVAASTNAWQFAGYGEWQQRGAEGRLDQRGTRRLTLPFALAPAADGRYRYLRIRELGGGIDTIVGGDRSLDIDLLPGEGRMFRVDIVGGDEVAADAAGNQLTRGFLGVNTQRKMVVYPTAAATLQPAADRWPYLAGSTQRMDEQMWVRADHGNGGYRYHRVFHRRMTEPDGMLTVYYQRSVPLTRPVQGTTTADDMIDAPSVEWEPEIELSTAIEADGTVGALSCAYPSLVVRRSPQSGNDLVYVVYACSTNVPLQVAICEAVLDANIAGHQQQRDDYVNVRRSRRLAFATAAPEQPCQADHLAYWGTPVINASYMGNYYAWSDYSANHSIVVGFKNPDERDGAAMAQLRLPIEAGNQAQFPSMPSYSRLQLGEEDCSIVWQEGPQGACESGTDIFYTRLRRYTDDTNRLFENNMQFNRSPFTESGVLLLYRNAQTVACLSCLETGHGAGAFNRRPTIYRHLSEFDDADMAPQNPLLNIGYINHKADRIMWEHCPPTPWAAPGPAPPVNPHRLAYKSVDVTDRTQPHQPNVWSSPVGFVESPQSHLRMPELIQGEQKTVLYTNAITDPDHVARSWRYGDTTLLASFVRQGVYGQSAVMHMTFYDDLFWNVPPGGTTTLPNVLATELYRGQWPHVSARPSIMHMPGLTMNRRIFEGTAPIAQPVGYMTAPSIGYTARGFFKETAQDATIDRVFHGYRANGSEATIGDIRINGVRIGMRPETVSQKKGKLLPTRYVTEWFTLDDLAELTVHARAEGRSDDDAEAFIERRSDGQRLPLPVLAALGAIPGRRPERTHRHSWDVLGQDHEEYRIVMAPRNMRVLPVQDIELAVTDDVAQARAGVPAPRGVLDLTTMTALDGNAGTGLTVQAVPNITVDRVTAVITGMDRQARTHVVEIVDLTGRVLTSVSLPSSEASTRSVPIDVSGLPPGCYHLRLAGTAAAATVIRR